MQQEKAVTRRRLLDARRSRSGGAISAARAAITDAVLARSRFDGWRRVAAYIPLRTEPGSMDLLAALAADGVQVLVPVLQSDNDLDWAPWPGGDPLGHQTVADVDAVLVPALAVAADGTRLGRGGGSYDRALARVPAGVPVAALIYDDELVAALPRAPWDVPVRAVVTPGGGWRELRPPRLDGE